MFKKLSFLIALAVVISLTSIAIAETMTISRDVEKVSSFSLTQNLETVTAVKNNNIASFEVSNNTRDGFTVDISSASGGNLVPASTDDGEANIAYTVDVSKDSGTLGGGMAIVSEVTDLSASSSIISKSGALQTSATTSLAVSLSIDFSAHADQFAMAGDYSDTITVTYTDL